MKASYCILTVIMGGASLVACSEAAPVDNPGTATGGTSSVAGTGGTDSTSGAGGSVATTAGSGGTESAMAGTGPGTAGTGDGTTGGSGGEPAQGGSGGDGTGGTGGSGAEVDTWANYGQEFFVTYCVSCHNDDNLGVASRDYHVFANVMGEESVIACGTTKSEEDHTARGCAQSPPARQFPPGNGPKPSDEERDRLIAWIDAGLPE